MVQFSGSRRRVISALAIVALVAGTAIALSFPTPASAGVMSTYYASPSGSGTTCSFASPCSLTGVRTKVRGVTAGMTGDIVVQLLDGTYRLTSTFTLDASLGDGGTNGWDVIYQALPGAKPVISGGKAITGWTAVGGGSSQWQASVTAGFTTRQLYVNGIRADRASGAVPGTLTQTATGHTHSPSSMATWGNRSDMEFVYNVEWTQIRCGIASIVGTAITMDQPCFDNSTKRLYGFNIDVAFDIRVENARELLDTPGEWYLNRSTNTVYYWPRAGENMTTAAVEAASLQTLVSGAGTSGSPLRNVTFRGITFSYAGWNGPDSTDGFSEIQANYTFTGANAYEDQGGCTVTGGSCPYGDWTETPQNVKFSHASDVLFERNTFTHLGAGGLGIGDYTADISVVGNVFRDIGGHGLQIGGVHHSSPGDPAVLPTRTLIKNNWVTDVGEDYKGAVGIFQGYTVSSVIEHNQVNHVPYSGISTGWSWGYAPTSASNNIIRANLVFDFMNELRDGGPIYTLGSQGTSIATGLRLDYNVVHGSKSNVMIYTDAGSRYVTLERNVIYDSAATQWGGCDLGTPYGDFVATDNYWPTHITSYPAACAGAATNVTINSQTVIADVNGAPPAYAFTAGLEPAYADIRGDAASRLNLAWHKPAVAQFIGGAAATMQVGSLPGAAVDGDPATYAQASGQWRWQLMVDLLDVQLVDHVRLLSAASVYATEFHVDTSINGSTWTTVSTVTGATAGTTWTDFTPAFARYVRVVADKPDGGGQTGGQMAIAELGVYGPQDLALEKPANAYNIDGSPAANQIGSNPNDAVDGIGSSYAQASGQWRWMQRVDLQSTHSISKVILTSGPGIYATDFHVDVSTNGSSWSTVSTVTGATNGTTTVSFTPTSARYVRVVADKPDGGGQTGGQMAISRLSVYGGTDPAIHSTATAQYIDGSPATMQHPAANAVDGDPATYAQATNQWRWQLTNDLGAASTIHEVRVLMPSGTYATEFNVALSTNGTTFTTAKSVTTVGVGGDVHVVLTTPTSARYVRIIAVKPDGPGQRGGQMGIAEISIS